MTPGNDKAGGAPAQEQKPSDTEKKDAMEEAQKEAAEEREEEGGYQ